MGARGVVGRVARGSLAAAWLGLAAACSSAGGDDGGGSGGGQPFGGSAGAGAGAGQGGSSGTGAASGSGGAAAAGGSGGTFSGGAGGTLGGSGGSGGGAGRTGCTKLDFLFVIDNSVSMQDQQAALVASFPGFVAAIESTTQAGSDYHILVTDTDAWGRCTSANGFVGHDPNSDTCNAYIRNTSFVECDRTLGAGVVHPAGRYASNQVCAVPDGRRYLRQGDPDVNDTFACMAKVGTAGNSSERPMDALVAAVAPGINGPGGCNEGFLRRDAVLVVTFISDDPNREDSGTPQSWYDAVVAAKGGDPDAVVMVGFTPAFDGCRRGSSINGAHWAEFVGMFRSSVHASVCLTDFSPVFAEAVRVIDDTCDRFRPPE